MIKLLPHAERQLIERSISLAEVKKVLLSPDQTIETTIKGRKIAQKILSRSKIKFLYRVVYTKEGSDYLVITAYRTTKIKKYFEEEIHEN